MFSAEMLFIEITIKVNRIVEASDKSFWRTAVVLRPSDHQRLLPLLPVERFVPKYFVRVLVEDCFKLRRLSKPIQINLKRPRLLQNLLPTSKYSSFFSLVNRSINFRNNDGNNIRAKYVGLKSNKGFWQVCLSIYSQLCYIAKYFYLPWLGVDTLLKKTIFTFSDSTVE